MKSQLNPELKIGDIIICYHMDGETSVPPGTIGTVVKISRDPFESLYDKIIEVKWDNGSNLGLISSTDAWKLLEKKTVQEQATNSNEYDFYRNNPEIFEHFDYRFFKEYLLKLRKSNVINMFLASPFLYSGKEWIDRYHGENQEDNEGFQEVLELADESKNKMIQGLLKYMESKNMDMEDMSKINTLIHKFAVKINQFYITF